MRLIDADALEDKIKGEWFEGYPRDIFFSYIEEMQTIEPALYLLAKVDGFLCKDCSCEEYNIKANLPPCIVKLLKEVKRNATD